MRLDAAEVASVMTTHGRSRFTATVATRPVSNVSETNPLAATPPTATPTATTASSDDVATTPVEVVVAVEAIRILIGAGAAIAAKDVHKQTVLHYAARSGCTPVLAALLLLVVRGSSSTGTGTGISTPSTIAGAFQYQDTQARGRGYGGAGSTDSACDGGSGARGGAGDGAGDGGSAVVGVSAIGVSLLESRDRWDRTALHWACLNREPLAVCLLLFAGADPNPAPPPARLHCRRTNAYHQVRECIMKHSVACGVSALEGMHTQSSGVVAVPFWDIASCTSHNPSHP
jgi:ankyrin repeat protein